MQEIINKALKEFADIGFPIKLNSFEVDGKESDPYSDDDFDHSIRLGFINGDCLTLDIFELEYPSLIPHGNKIILFEIGYMESTGGSWHEPPDADYVCLYNTTNIYEALSVFHALDQSYHINNRLASEAEYAGN